MGKSSKKLSQMFVLDEVDFILALSSVGGTRNISLVDLFCNRIAVDATLKSGTQWRYLNQLSSSDRVSFNYYSTKIGKHISNILCYEVYDTLIVYTMRRP